MLEGKLSTSRATHHARTPCTRHGLAAPAFRQRGAALRAVPLDRRSALDVPVARGAPEQRRLEPLTRAAAVGERDLAREVPRGFSTRPALARRSRLPLGCTCAQPIPGTSRLIRRGCAAMPGVRFDPLPARLMPRPTRPPTAPYTDAAGRVGNRPHIVERHLADLRGRDSHRAANLRRAVVPSLRPSYPTPSGLPYRLVCKEREHTHRRGPGPET